MHYLRSPHPPDALFANREQIQADIKWLQRQFPLLSAEQFSLVPHELFSTVSVSAPKPYAGPKRIGFYYQWLLTELIHHHPQLRLEAEEIQVNESGKTRGAD
ncbi:hypothetical protein [Salinivibrio socompensis]|uniref:hypothetical protein n=1 Tax=Salinivibrio socompensis TaxID=1510206 RepID=UPI0006883E64|nr:hypothetical protein [Salinivibrio socompensis]